MIPGPPSHGVNKMYGAMAYGAAADISGHQVNNDRAREEGDLKAGKNIETKGSKEKKNSQVKECKTCKTRRYKDVSNDSGASMQTATSVPEEVSAAVVLSHEAGHIDSAEVKAQKEGREVTSAYVQIYTAVCPECGKVYAAGGKATIQTRDKPKNSDSSKGIFVDRYA